MPEVLEAAQDGIPQEVEEQIPAKTAEEARREKRARERGEREAKEKVVREADAKLLFNALHEKTLKELEQRKVDLDSYTRWVEGAAKDIRRLTREVAALEKFAIAGEDEAPVSAATGVTEFSRRPLDLGE